jgi:hypothetical protein
MQKAEEKNSSPWSREEDKLLSNLVVKYGRRWEWVSLAFPGRSKAAIKQRYYRFYEK